MNTRIGTFSSSEIWKLMTTNRKGDDFGAPALTYIQEKRWERKLGLPIRSEKNARPSNWGTFCEGRVFNILTETDEHGWVYDRDSKQRYVHADFPEWTGEPDFVNHTTVGDIKCPYSRAAFCKEVDVIDSPEFPLYDEFPEYYWQLVSNSILTGKKYAELIVYMPYQSELAEIKEMANNFDGGLNKISFISFAEEEELPYILDNGNYKNVNKLRWEVSKSDQELLTEKVKQAIALL